MSERTLYELAGADEQRRFSPFCWRTRLALAHKGLAVDPVAWRFVDKETIAFSGQAKVPVLVDGERTVHDSWAIASYLEQTYPDAPSLFGGAGGMAHARFINAWADSVLQPAIAKLVMADILDHLHEKDRAYFRSSREALFGVTLEAMRDQREQALPALRAALTPLRLMLRSQPFIGGQSASYADYIVFGAFQWARCISDYPLLAADDQALVQWTDRLLDAFGGLARQAPGYRIAAAA